MNSDNIMNQAFQKYKNLKSSNNYYKNQLITELEQLEHLLSHGNDLNEQTSSYYRSLDIEKLQKHITADKKKLNQYQTQVQDEQYVVICPWTENDLSDSNTDLVSNKNMQSWKQYGCKLYGKASQEPGALNDYDNRGYFANFNYPINIVKNPSVYYFSPKELKPLYTHLMNHNPSISHLLLQIAVKCTITVKAFKQAFHLDEKSLKERINKIKSNEANGIPNPDITQLQDYYQWLLSQRQSRTSNDLSQYSDVNSSPSDFTENINSYRIYANDSSDIPMNNYDTNINDYTPSDIDDDYNYQGYTPSDIASGIEYEDENISDNNEDE